MNIPWILPLNSITTGSATYRPYCETNDFDSIRFYVHRLSGKRYMYNCSVDIPKTLWAPAHRGLSTSLQACLKRGDILSYAQLIKGYSNACEKGKWKCVGIGASRSKLIRQCILNTQSDRIKVESDHHEAVVVNIPYDLVSGTRRELGEFSKLTFDNVSRFANKVRTLGPCIHEANGETNVPSAA